MAREQIMSLVKSFFESSVEWALQVKSKKKLESCLTELARRMRAEYIK
jgi:hypothetical protein